MSIDPNEIDLLVDGELPDERRKHLLLSFEQRPEGWRACALAFLEAQCWREQMRGLADAVRPSPSPSPEKPASAQATPTQLQITAGSPARRRPTTQSAVRTVLAMAASFLLTMVGVGLLRMHWKGGDAPSGQDFVQKSDREEGGSAHSLDYSTPPQIADNFRARPDSARGAGADGPMSLFTVQLPGGAQGGREVLLPVVEPEHFNDGLLAPSPPADIDPHLEALARQHGMELQRHRQLMPLHTHEGHDIVVPVNNYQFRRRDAADIQ